MSKSTLQISYIGHATFLLQTPDLLLLTDPNFSKKNFLFHKRRMEPGIPPAEIPSPAAILISNACYDHLDLFSYKYFKTKIPLIVPKGLGKFTGRFLPNPITEVAPGGFHQHFETRIDAVPVAHRGHRLLPIKFRRSSGYVIQAPQGTVYFPGDSTYGSHFKEVGSQFRIDIALLPLRHWPKKTSRKVLSLSPEEALQAGKDLRAKHLIPYSLDTFKSGKEDPLAVLDEFREKISPDQIGMQVHILHPGEFFELTREAPHLYPISPQANSSTGKA